MKKSSFKRCGTICLVALATMVFVFVGSLLLGNRTHVAEATHKHSFSWKVIKQPNCKESGYQNLVCS